MRYSVLIQVESDSENGVMNMLKKFGDITLILKSPKQKEEKKK
jgi:hypothetical protein